MAAQPTTPNTGADRDVAIVGAGPVGLYLALVMGRARHQVIVLEKQPAPYPRPRAVHFDHEIARLLAGVGFEAELSELRDPTDYYDWVNADRELLLRLDFSGDGPSGWPLATMFHQPDLERALEKHVRSDPNITILRGEQVSHLTVDADGVTLLSHSVTSKRRETRVRYVVGCDGANSFVRERIGTTVTDLGFFYDWLVVDVLPKEHRIWSPTNLQVCDPVRPTTVVSGGPGRRRFEFMRMPGESTTELEAEETVWSLIEPWGLTPENAELERHVIYTFQARWADTWYRNRMAIAGDAAHLMPPFAGQGMCSGLRDAANLAWKLDLVLRGLAAESLLGTYTTERAAHVRHAIEESVALGNVICVTDPEGVAARDGHFLAHGPNPEKVLPPIAPATLGPGVLASGEQGPGTGALAFQPRVRMGEREGRFDQVVGGGFHLLSPLAAKDVLDAERQSKLAMYGVRWVQLVPSTAGDAAAVVDIDDVVLPHLAEVGHCVAAVRPDHYLYGTVGDPADIPAFVDELCRQLAGLPTDVAEQVAG